MVKSNLDIFPKIDPIEAMRQPHFNVVVLDMQGIQYAFTPEKGISVWDYISPEAGAKGDEVYTKAVRDLHIQLYGKEALSQLEASLEVEQNTEAELVNRILKGEEAPCGIVLSEIAAMFVYYTIAATACCNCQLFENDVYKVIVISSAQEEVSKALLRRNLERFMADKRGRVKMGVDSDDLSNVVDYYNMADFGSKKSPEAWEKVFRKVKQTYPFASEEIAIYEDNPGKRDAAVQGAQRAGLKPYGQNVLNQLAKVTVHFDSTELALVDLRKMTYFLTEQYRR